MRTFPQEIVDKVIDELPLYNGGTSYNVPYSLVSKAWVTRTQKHCFRSIVLDGVDYLEKWGRNIAPDPAGVSRHTHELFLFNVDTLEDFEAHIHAFTRVKDLKIIQCKFLLSSSPSIAEYFAPTCSNLTQLRIDLAETTSRIITSLLAGLPQLKHFTTLGLKVTDDTGGTNLVSRIPFFEGNNSLVLHTHWEQNDSPGPPDWIPPSARFENLEIDITYFLHKAASVNQWFSNSCTTLTSFSINVSPDFPLSNPVTPLDLSSCHALTRLCIPIRISEPEIVAKTVLPSITSSQLSFVSMESWEDSGDLDQPVIDYPAWTAVENHLCRLAKHFSAENLGKKMKVGVCGDWFRYEPQESDLLDHPIWKRVFSRLTEEAIVDSI